MKTLYDLLGALPDDDADELRTAFRKAAKANHPDNNPGNPEAAEKFRKIVRANAILGDGQQRAAYDRMLVVARRQQGLKPKRSAFSGTIRRLAADAAVSAVVSVVLIGGYLLYRPFESAARRFVADHGGIRTQSDAATYRQGGRTSRGTRPGRSTRTSRTTRCKWSSTKSSKLRQPK